MNGDGSPREVGVVEWFRTGEYERVERVLDLISKLGVRQLRTGVSWAEFQTGEGTSWYDWLLPRLAESIDLLPCFACSPPSATAGESRSALFCDPRDYADVLDRLIERYGACFQWIELLNEPNDLQTWNASRDTGGTVFREMTATAARRARVRGKQTVLGGIPPTDLRRLGLLAQSGTLEHVDAVGLSGAPGLLRMPGTPSFDGKAWEAHVCTAREVLSTHGMEAGVWITEAGYSTWRNDEFAQLSACADLLQATAERAYWYAVQDRQPAEPDREDTHANQRHYHFGLFRHDGRAKLLARVWAQGALVGVSELAQLGGTHGQDQAGHACEGGRKAAGTGPSGNGNRKKLDTNGHPSTNGSGGRPNSYTLVTGGAGFIGTNVADRLLTSGQPVRILDSLSRPGVEGNLRWLRRRHGDLLQVQLEDVRDRWAVSRAVENADRIFHFAGQVAVTSSVERPREDFDVNAGGTLNVLEAIRNQNEPPPLLFTSTNKVYGSLDDIRLRREEHRYVPVDETVFEGVGSDRPLDFESPYGCSKGSADMYVLDYARMYGLPTVVFRMSCIYGPHQRGTEDQGWVAHFMVRALQDNPITIYGDGRQVRDVLYVEDVVDAMLAAVDSIDRTRGRAFNIGGGPGRAVSLLQVLDIIRELHGTLPEITFEDWRPSDQKYYVSDTTPFSELTGWRPKVRVDEGLALLRDWLLVGRPVSPLALPA